MTLHQMLETMEHWARWIALRERWPLHADELDARATWALLELRERGAEGDLVALAMTRAEEDMAARHGASDAHAERGADDAVVEPVSESGGADPDVPVTPAPVALPPDDSVAAPPAVVVAFPARRRWRAPVLGAVLALAAGALLTLTVRPPVDEQMVMKGDAQDAPHGQIELEIDRGDEMATTTGLLPLRPGGRTERSVEAGPARLRWLGAPPGEQGFAWFEPGAPTVVPLSPGGVTELGTVPAGAERVVVAVVSSNSSGGEVRARVDAADPEIVVHTFALTVRR